MNDICQISTTVRVCSGILITKKSIGELTFISFTVDFIIDIRFAAVLTFIFHKKKKKFRKRSSESKKIYKTIIPVGIRPANLQDFGKKTFTFCVQLAKVISVDFLPMNQCTNCFFSLVSMFPIVDKKKNGRMFYTRYNYIFNFYRYFLRNVGFKSVVFILTQ